MGGIPLYECITVCLFIPQLRNVCVISCLWWLKIKSFITFGLGLPWWLWGKELASVLELLEIRGQLIWGWLILLWRRAWQPTPVFLPGESHGQRSLAGYSPWGCKESDMAEHARMWRFWVIVVFHSTGVKDTELLSHMINMCLILQESWQLPQIHFHFHYQDTRVFHTFILTGYSWAEIIFGIIWNLIVFWRFISPLTNDMEHLFMWLSSRSGLEWGNWGN